MSRALKNRLSLGVLAGAGSLVVVGGLGGCAEFAAALDFANVSLDHYNRLENSQFNSEDSTMNTVEGTMSYLQQLRQIQTDYQALKGSQ